MQLLTWADLRSFITSSTRQPSCLLVLY